MTKDEALKILKGCRENGFKYTFYTLGEYHAALDMAITALEQEPCPDAISRQAAIVQLLHNKNADSLDAFSRAIKSRTGESMSKIYFEVEGDVVIKHTPMPEIGENTYKTEVVITKKIFQECYKKWVESQESEEQER